MNYRTTQHGIWGYVLAGIGVCLVLGSTYISDWDEMPEPLRILLGLVAIVLMLTSWVFSTLTVSDEGDHLKIAFGPLPLVKKRLPYADVSRVEAARSRVIDGWGIHWVPGRGWTWNIHGFDCVEVHLLDGGLLRVGTPEPEKLARMIRERLELG